MRIFKGIFLLIFLIIFGFSLYAQNELKEVGKNASGEELFTYSCKNEDIRNIISMIAKRKGINVIAGTKVTGKVSTLRFDRVTLDEALEAILKVGGYAAVPIGTGKIVRIVPIGAVGKEEAVTRSYTLKYQNAGTVQKEVKSMLSPIGKALVNAKSNMLTVKDIPKIIEEVDSYIKKIDEIPMQVVINSKLIEMNWGDSQDIGVSWNLEISAKGGERSTTFPFNINHGSDSFTPAMTPASPTLTVGTISASNLSAALRMIESSSESHVIASPRVVAMNNQVATINVGSNIPIPNYERSSETGSMEITGYAEVKIGVELKVRPTINHDKFISMDLQPKVSEITGWTGPNNERPITSERTATTKAIVRNGETVVLGGMLKEKTTDAISGVPFLNKIPVLKYLFGSKRTTVEKIDLLIFITPTIMEISE
jgi:type IV pilus secretin PilQ/predicted competence protein